MRPGPSSGPAGRGGRNGPGGCVGQEHGGGVVPTGQGCFDGGPGAAQEHVRAASAAAGLGFGVGGEDKVPRQARCGRGSLECFDQDGGEVHDGGTVVGARRANETGQPVGAGPEGEERPGVHGLFQSVPERSGAADRGRGQDMAGRLP
jgi:hypothetical protein